MWLVRGCSTFYKKAKATAHRAPREMETPKRMKVRKARKKVKARKKIKALKARRKR